MLIIFYFMLSVVVGRCKDNLSVGTRTVAVGEDVTLTCPRSTSEHRSSLYWIRFIPGHWPEFLGGTYSFDFSDSIETAHITAKQETKSFILHISKVQHGDAGLYYCLKVNWLNMTFLTGEFLRISGKESNITTIVQHPLPDRVHPGSPVSLHCSVLFNTQDKTCSTDHRVFWFLAASDKSNPSLIYAPANPGSECKNNPEDHSGRKCIYSFSKNVTASDVGTYYCAVASCGMILFGNGTKLDIEGPSMSDLQKTNAVFIVLFAILTASVIIIFILTYILMKKTCHCSNDAKGAHDDQQIQQRGENSLVYSAPILTKRKAAKIERRNKETSEVVYSGVN
ncbi:uncharacterized protein LOC114138848 [Xiphophorus couchianus]|uniref:uncharacterized protein LOC114138848 n=1 Tax=Xiphophorus couchianus TaxID=32473 RepID=UPI001016B98E|nr:uncharacterized protein LOC114138848 [Xiphophorus couchianus]